jgi:predicted lipoprotein
MSARKIQRWAVRPWIVLLAVAIIVVFLAASNVTIVSIEDADSGAGDGFGPTEYAEEHYGADIVPTIESDAVDLATLLTDLANGADPSEFGNTAGTASAYAFPVTFDAVVGTVVPPTLPVDVEGLPPGVNVVVQVGPALNGTALRDVTGTVSFNEFQNQSEYLQVATELNSLARVAVLNDFDAIAAAGKKVRVTGAFLRVNPALVSVVPIAIEVIP